MMINEDKSKYMIFALHNRSISSNTHINTRFIPVESHKDLGVILDNRLSYKFHINNIINQLNRKYAFTARYFAIVKDKHILQTWFHAAFVSSVVYDIQLYAAGLVSSLNHLNEVWNRIIKKINSIHLSNSQDSISNILHLPTIEELRNKHDIQMLTKFLKGNLPPEIIIYNVPQIKSRKINLLHIRKKKLEKSHRSFSIRACKMCSILCKCKSGVTQKYLLL